VIELQDGVDFRTCESYHGEGPVASQGWVNKLI